MKNKLTSFLVLLTALFMSGSTMAEETQLPEDGGVYNIKFISFDETKTWGLKTEGATASVVLNETGSEFVAHKYTKFNGDTRYIFVNNSDGYYLAYQSATADFNVDHAINEWEVGFLASSNSSNINSSANLEGKLYITNDKRYTNNAQRGCYILKEENAAFDNSTAPFYNGQYTSALIFTKLDDATIGTEAQTAIEKFDLIHAKRILTATYDQYAGLSFGTLYGQYSIDDKEALVAFENAVNEAKEVKDSDFEGKSADELNQLTEKMNEAYSVILPMLVLDNRNTTMESGYYRIKTSLNYNDGITKYLSAENTGTVLKGVWGKANENIVTSLWRLTAEEADFTFDLENVAYGARFNPSTGTNSEFTLTTDETGKVYINPEAYGDDNHTVYVNIRYATDSGTYIWMHQKGHSSGAGKSDNVIAWSNGGAAASQWILEKVSDEEAASIVEALNGYNAALADANHILSNEAIVGDNLFQVSETNFNSFADAVTENTLNLGVATVDGLKSATDGLKSATDNVEAQTNLPEENATYAIRQVVTGKYLNVDKSKTPENYSNQGGQVYVSENAQAFTWTAVEDGYHLSNEYGSVGLFGAAQKWVMSALDEKACAINAIPVLYEGKPCYTLKEEYGLIADDPSPAVQEALGFCYSDMTTERTNRVYWTIEKVLPITLDETSNVESVIEEYDDKVCDVTLNRSIKQGYNTVVLPFTLSAKQVQAIFGEGSTVYSYSENSEDANNVTINFNTVAEGTIAANVPVLVEATETASESTIKSVAVKHSTSPVAEGTNVNFVGVYNATTVVEGDYFISDGKLYKSAGETSIKPFRAYLDATSAGAEVKLFIDGTATSIESINGAAEAEDGAIYNLAGQRVGKAQKGIYIVNGKKVIVK